MKVRNRLAATFRFVGLPALMFCFAMTFVLTGCSNKGTNTTNTSLIGKWRISSHKIAGVDVPYGGNIGQTYEFVADSSGTWKDAAGSLQTDYDWSIKGDSILIKYSLGTEAYWHSISQSSMTWRTRDATGFFTVEMGLQKQ